MGGKPSPDNSGVTEALISAQAAQQEYQLGEQQLQWAKDVWNQEQPLVSQADQLQIQLAQQQLQAQQTAQQEAAQQWDTYQQYYMPLEKQLATETQNWASPQAMALATGQAQGSIAENVQGGINTAKEALLNYGVNPDAPELAGLYIGANTVGAASEAAGGTMAAQNLRNQQMQLEQNAAQTGLALSGQSGQLTQVGTGAGAAGGQLASGAASTSQQNLATGSSAYTAPVNWYNSGATNMGVYTNAVNQYNQQQYQMAALGGQELGSAMTGLGKVAGSFLTPAPIIMAAEGGPINGNGNSNGNGNGNGNGNSSTGLPPPPNGTPGGFVTPDQSPSGGQQVDDVDAKLTVGEFVMPKDVVDVKGTDFFYKLIDSTRKSAQQNSSRDDIGGEQVSGIPSGPPAFVSRPQGSQSPPSVQPQQMPQGMPSRPMMPMPAPNFG